KLPKETQQQLISSIQLFFREEMDDEMGELRAQQVLDFCLKTIGPSIYNQAISDAQGYFRDKVEDLDGAFWIPEATRWKP
ncbi:MAG TPA: DUF2164 domain-containing protein, partial [Myxococcales bacterium]|nr:DUF2164 domain-containing protein [Myxococcales bacterium]